MNVAGVSLPGALAALLRKEWLIETRLGARLGVLLSFSWLLLFLFSFAAGPNARLLTPLAPGFLWIAMLLTAVLRLGQSMQHEEADGAVDGLLLLPTSSVALFLAKAAINTAIVWLVGLLALPVAIALFDSQLRLGLWPVAFGLALGAGAIGAPGTLFAALTARARAGDVLLPMLLFPLLVPGLVGAVRATSLAMLGDGMGEMGSWWAFLALFNGLYWPLCAALFVHVVDG